MTTSRLPTLLAGFVACGALVAAVAIARADPFDHKELPNGPYVAMGDSYTAGPEIPDQAGTPAGCRRSNHNYPALVAQSLQIDAADFQDVSCSGATIADLAAAQSTTDGVNPAQLSALSGETRLVTLGIGGNDIDFSALIKRCVMSGVLYYATGIGRYFQQDTSCRGQYVAGGADEVRQKTEAAGERLAETLSEIKRRAPRARVYVVGYPAILPATGNTCERDLPLTPLDMAYLLEKQQDLNATLRERARAAGAAYVDTYAPSVGHDACSGESTRWIEPLRPQAAAASVHPNERGERGMADAVLHMLDAASR